MFFTLARHACQPITRSGTLGRVWGEKPYGTLRDRFRERRRRRRRLARAGGPQEGPVEADGPGLGRAVDEPLSRKPARMQARPRSSPRKNSEVMPKRVRPLATLGTKAPTAIRTLDETPLGSVPVRQKRRALITAPRISTNAPLMLNGGVSARVSASSAWPLTT